MKTVLIVISGLCWSLSALAQNCPTFVFFSENPGRCEGRVDLAIFPCSASVTDPYTVDYVEWNLGDGTVATTTGTEYEHTYATSGYKTITGVVHCTVNGVACSTNVIGYGSTVTQSGIAFGGLSPDEVCAHTQISYNYDVNVYLGNVSLYIDQPAQPSVIYSNTPVDISAIYSQLLNLPSTYTYSVTVDGVTVLSGSVSALPATILTDYYFTPGQHVVELHCVDSRTEHFWMGEMSYCGADGTLLVEVQDSTSIPPCENCFTFKPDRNKRYWISAWVKEDIAQVKTYTNTAVNLAFDGSSETFTLIPTGEIIDGWQRIAGEFTVPANATSIAIRLNNTGAAAAYFDDIRVHPYNASMKSYVNDAETFWMVAELDDNNYATFYEYDKEGQLIRIKKETARGIVTIQESRSSNPKN